VGFEHFVDAPFYPHGFSGFRSLLQSGLSEVAAKGEPDDREALVARFNQFERF
jgi:hypothetical protein